MTREKDLKRLVRARMKKTGEAYTAARAQLLRKSAAPSPKAAPAPKPAPKSKAAAAVAPIAPAKYAEIAGMADAVVKEKTGRVWEKWVATLDRDGAAELKHGEIAELVSGRYGVADWWSQMVTVGYERIKGLRARGQRMDGTYEASKSRTFAVPVGTLFDAWADARMREQWLDAPESKVRKATKPKSLRFQLGDGAIIALWFTAKGKDRSSVALTHVKLPDRETAERMKTYWGDQLDALARVLDA